MRPDECEGIDEARKTEEIIHELKTWPIYFDWVLTREKTFEIRRNDRDFQSGDKVILREWNPDEEYDYKYTGREIRAEIGYVTTFGQKEGYVVFSLLNITEE